MSLDFKISHILDFIPIFDWRALNRLSDLKFFTVLLTLEISVLFISLNSFNYLSVPAAENVLLLYEQLCS
jgi:hypothetical protein